MDETLTLKCWKYDTTLHQATTWLYESQTFKYLFFLWIFKIVKKISWSVKVIFK